MPITVPKAALGAAAATLLLCCGYLVGYWMVFGDSLSTSISVERLLSLSPKLVAGLGIVGAALAAMVMRMARVGDTPLKRLAVIVCGLAVLGAMYVATYDRLVLADAYPFVMLFGVIWLLFRSERRTKATILFGVLMLTFYIIAAKEIGERDAERDVAARQSQQFITAQ